MSDIRSIMAPIVEHLAPLDKTSLKKSHEIQAEVQQEVSSKPQANPFLEGADFQPPEEPQQQPYIPADDRTNRHILLGLDTSLTQFDQRMTKYEENQREILRLWEVI